MYTGTGNIPQITAAEAEAEYDARAVLRERGAKSWVWNRNGEAVDVIVALTEWPEVTVVIKSRRAGPEVAGVFSRDGRLERLQFEARFGERVHATDLRRIPAVSALTAWEAVARVIARQIIAGIPDEELAFDTTSPAAALESLSKATSRKPGGRVRAAAAHEELVRQVAEAYEAAAGQRAPRKAVAAQFGYSAAHVSRLLAEARRLRGGRPPLLTLPTRGTRRRGARADGVADAP